MLADSIRKGNETSHHAQLVWRKPDTCPSGSYSEQLLVAHCCVWKDLSSVSSCKGRQTQDEFQNVQISHARPTQNIREVTAHNHHGQFLQLDL